MTPAVSAEDGPSCVVGKELTPTVKLAARVVSESTVAVGNRLPSDNVSVNKGRLQDASLSESVGNRKPPVKVSVTRGRLHGAPTPESVGNRVPSVSVSVDREKLEEAPMFEDVAIGRLPSSLDDAEIVTTVTLALSVMYEVSTRPGMVNVTTLADA